MNKLKAVITGGSSGIGKELALLMAKKGHHVLIIGRNEAALKETVSASGENSEIDFIKADLSEIRQAKEIIAKAISLMGNIDVLVNNAGASVSGSIKDIPEEEFDRIWRVNFLAPLSLIKQVLPFMEKQGEGKIVNISSGVAKRALPFESPYCASKAALNSMSESLRVELKGTPIKLLYFSPGPVETGFHAARKHFGNNELVAPPFKGRNPSEIAEILYEAISENKERVTLGWKASLVHHLNYVSPKTVDNLLGRMFRLETKKLSEET